MVSYDLDEPNITIYDLNDIHHRLRFCFKDLHGLSLYTSQAVGIIDNDHLKAESKLLEYQYGGLSYVRGLIRDLERIERILRGLPYEG